MNVTITARHFKLQDDLNDYMESKLKRLDRYNDNIIDADLVLGWEKQERYAELKLNLNHSQIVLKEVTDDLKKSFDLLMDKAERQLKREKEKRQKH